ncbi:MAG TPA: murein biosynthesis integral membrane protein MurJ [Deltaproteobacteria bacterium]|nr:murein biosynthesis integral membrane protein MurJ [Deltaproteobacteria bacterium]
MPQQKKSENSQVARAAGTVSIATMMSRVFGLARDMVIAAFFGAGWKTDAFWIAFRIPNMLRRIVAEGSFTISFVPVFTEYLQKRSKKEALELASAAFTLLSIVLVIITVLGILLSPVIVGLIAPGFIKDPAQFSLAVFLNRLMFPYIFFIGLVALCMGILNSLRHFIVPALSPVILNIAMIGAAFALRNLFAEPITVLAVGVLIGGILQLLMQWPVLVKYGAKLKFKINFQHPGIRQISVLLLPAIFTASVNILNVFIGSILASLLPSGSVTYLFYADRVMELPIGVFALAVGTATLPSFSRHAANDNIDELKSSISFSLRITFFVVVPAMAALMMLSQPIISVLFQRGAFDAHAAVLTGQALFYYSLGLWAFAVIRLFITSFYSLQDSKWPMKAAIVSFVINVTASLILMHPMKHNGLALAGSLAVTANVLILMLVLKNKIGNFLDGVFYASLSKIIISSVVMMAAIHAVGYWMPWNIAADFPQRLLYLGVCIFTGTGVYFVTAYFMKSPEIHALVNVAKRQLGRPPG